MAVTHSSRLKNSEGKKYYISLDDTFGNSSYSVYSFSDNTDYDNKTGTLIYTEPLKGLKKGATDDLLNDNAKYEEISSSCIEKSKKYDWAKTTNELESLYKQLVG